MGDLTIAVGLSWLAGLAAVVGGAAAWMEGSARSESERIGLHAITAFGGGVLLAAVAFALVPEGMHRLAPLWLAALFIAGGLFSFAMDMALARSGGSKAQFAAMVMDFLPEALSLGAVFSHDRRMGLLLAAFIGIQNLPEGFNAFRDIREGGGRPRNVLLGLLAASLIGPLAAAIGFLVLQDQQTITAGIMTFAGGGIVYLVFQDIAPRATMPRHWLPTLGAVFGFCVGMLGKALMG